MSGVPRCKAERLAVSGAIAPVLRDQASRVANRRVACVDEHGNVVGYTTLLEVQKQLVARHALEIEVQPDEKPREVMCVRCGLPVPVPKVGRTPRFCTRCKSAKCSVCGDSLKKGATMPWKNARRKSAPRCSACIAKQSEARRNEVRCSECAGSVSKKTSVAVRMGRKDAATVRCRDCYVRYCAEARRRNAS